MRTALLASAAVLALGMIGLGVPSASAHGIHANVPIAAAGKGGTNAAASQDSSSTANSGTVGSFNAPSKTVTVTKDNGNTRTTSVSKDNGNSTQVGLAKALGLGNNAVGNGTLASTVTRTTKTVDVDLTFASAHAGGSLEGGGLHHSGFASNTLNGNIGVITANANSGLGQFNTSVAVTGVDNGIQMGGSR